MKYLVIVGDGMADFPLDALDGRTPLSALDLPGFARVAGGQLGRFRSCPEGLPPGSDVAFLSLLGNDPTAVYTGRSPLEAAGMGIPVRDGDVAFRMNLATIGDGGYPDATVISHNGGGIDGQDARTLVTDLIQDAAFSRLMRDAGLTIYPTDTFRHVAVMPGRASDFLQNPPHDVLGQPVIECGSKGARGPLMAALERASFDFLSRHPVNDARRAAGLLPANIAWFWGAGTACQLKDFEEAFGAKGTVISAVPLVKGIARLMGIHAPDCPFATGLLDTGYEEKAEAVLEAFARGDDFALVHLEAPDEMSHEGSLARKLEAIRRLDARIVQPLLDAMPRFGDHRVLLMPDHYTSLTTRTHDGAPVPFALYDSRSPGAPRPFTEAACAAAPVLASPDALMNTLMQSRH